MSSFINLLNTIRSYHQVISDNKALTNLLNDAFSDWLASKGIGRIALLDNGKLILNVDGWLKTEGLPSQASINLTNRVTLYNHFVAIELHHLESLEEAASCLEEALAYYFSEGDGAYVWIVPDGYMASLSEAEKEWEARGGGYFSHESICVSNTSDIDTRCRLEVLYEDPERGRVTVEFDVPAHKSTHYRLDKLKGENGEPLIAKNAPTSYKLVSLDARVVVQGSRILTSGKNSEFASFGTVMAWCPQQRR
jgi:hypothetical protein